MEHNANRWMATIAILGLFGIFAAAGSRAPVARQGVQNVLVTNAANQQVPVLPAARPTPNGAYIVSIANTPGVRVTNATAAPVPVKDVHAVDSTSTQISGTLSMPISGYEVNATIPLPNATPVIIDSVSFISGSTVAGESASEAFVLVTDSKSALVGQALFALQHPSDNKAVASYAGNYRLIVPANGSVSVELGRNGGTTTATHDFYTLSYHTVPI